MKNLLKWLLVLLLVAALCGGAAAESDPDPIVASGESGDHFALITGEEPEGTEYFIDLWNFWGMEGALDADGNPCPKYVSIRDETLYRDTYVSDETDPEAWISGRYMWETYLAPGAKYASYATQYVYVQVDSDDKWFWTLSNSGVLTVTGTGEIMESPWDADAVTSVVIHDGITGIGMNVFHGCSSLSCVTLPKSVTDISDSAFPHQSALTAINVDSGNTAYSSIDGVLYNADQTELIFCPGGKTGIFTVPAGVTGISHSAFSSCTRLTGVILPQSLVSIGRQAFNNCNGLTGIQIPAGVTDIGDGIFSMCSNLTDIAVAEGNSVFMSENGLLYDKNQTVVYCCPGAKTGEIVLPGSVRTIQAHAFQVCRSVTSVVLPAGVTYIGEVAFNACGLQSITIPASLEEIGDAAFFSCRNLTDVCYTGSEEQWSEIKIGTQNEPLTSADIHYNCQASEIVAYGTCGVSLTWTLDENGVLAIAGSGPMYNYITEVPENAPWRWNSGTITAVEIAEGVTSIGDYAFRFATMTRISIPESVTYIGVNAFQGCSALTDIYYAGQEADWWDVGIEEGNEAVTDDGVNLHCLEPADLAWTFADGTLTISGNGPMRHYESPYYEGETLAPWLAYCDEIQRIVIEEGVTSIGNEAFDHYPVLTEVFMADSVTRIGNSAFRDCPNLSGVRFSDGLTSIGWGAFYNCTALTSVSLPSSLKTISSMAFVDCSLTNIAFSGDAAVWHFFYAEDDGDYLYCILLPAGVTRVDSDAFYGNPLPHENPDFVTPSSLETIEAEALSGTKARFVWLSNSVENVGSGAFSGCGTLQFAYIPYGCENIAEGAFPEGTIILGFYGSAAETWAEDNNCVFVGIENPYGGNG